MIEERKKEIVEKYGIDPTICFHFYLWNAINYIGEKNVRQAFESIRNQGDEIIVGDYSSTDGTKELAEEYGFKVVSVEKTPGITLHESKIVNRVVKESKSNFLVDLDIHTVYPKDMGKFIKDWIVRSDITKKVLAVRGLFIDHYGSLIRQYAHSSSCAIYRPYLLRARGYDETTYYGYGTTYYALGLLLDVYKLTFDNQNKDDMIHRFHMREKVRTWALDFDITENNCNYKNKISEEIAITLLKRLHKDFDIGVKEVKNSYW